MAVGSPNINGYLTRIAKHLLLDDLHSKEVQKIIRQLRSKLDGEFGDQISEINVFGSYARKTALEPKIDPNVDVDLMIVFSDRGYQPQTYLERLKRFAERHYPKKLSSRDHPAVVLKLSEFKFDLVPAVHSLSPYPYKIPERGRLLTDWRRTDPKDFNTALIRANKKNDHIVKPLIRCLKYWNICQGRPFNSYDLENNTVFDTVNRFFRWKHPETLREFFFTAITDLSDQINMGDWYGAEPSDIQIEALSYSKLIIDESKALNARPDGEHRALLCFQNILPSPW